MTESSQKCPPADKPVSERASAPEPPYPYFWRTEIQRVKRSLHKLTNVVNRDLLPNLRSWKHRYKSAHGSLMRRAEAAEERAEKAEREVERLTAACRFALDEWFEPHYGTNDVGMAALVRDRIRAALRGDNK